MDLAGARQRGKREEEAGEELAAHGPRDRGVARVDGAAHGERQARTVLGPSDGRPQRFQGGPQAAHGTSGQGGGPEEGHRTRTQRGHRGEKAQGGARLPGTDADGPPGAGLPRAQDPKALGPAARSHVGPQGPDRVPAGERVLAPEGVVYGVRPSREEAGDQRPVGVGFGGGRANLAPGHPPFDGHDTGRARMVPHGPSRTAAANSAGSTWASPPDRPSTSARCRFRGTTKATAGPLPDTPDARAPRSLPRPWRAE